MKEREGRGWRLWDVVSNMIGSDEDVIGEM